MIFEQVFVNTLFQLKAWGFESRSNPDIRKHPSMADPALGMFFVSRQLHTETALLPYKLFTLQIHPFSWQPRLDEARVLAKCFLQERSQEQVEAISDLAVEVYWSRDRCAFLRGTGSSWIEWLNSDKAGKWLEELLYFQE